MSGYWALSFSCIERVTWVATGWEYIEPFLQIRKILLRLAGFELARADLFNIVQSTSNSGSWNWLSWSPGLKSHFNSVQVCNCVLCFSFIQVLYTLLLNLQEGYLFEFNSFVERDDCRNLIGITYLTQAK